MEGCKGTVATSYLVGMGEAKRLNTWERYQGESDLACLALILFLKIDLATT
jgi:hypothetical protein